MPLPIDPTQLNPVAQRVLAATAPVPVKMMAASGVVPGLPAGDVVTVVALLTQAEQPEVAAKARDTIRKLPGPILTGALSADLDPFVLVHLADGYAGSAEVVEKLLRMPRINREALEILAIRANERIGEIVATNEERLLQNPTVIEKLYMNKQVRMSTADRILELAVRNGLTLDIPAYKEAAQAIKNELIAEASEEPTYEDQIAKEVDQIAATIMVDAKAEDTHDIDDEGEEQVKEKMLPLYAQILKMPVSQRIRKAMTATPAELLLLTRDKNRLVAMAAVQSPKMTEHEAARISSSRQISEDVLRAIAMNREWTRSYQIKLNLVSNPRTPMSFTSRLVPQLHEHDVKTLSKSKNVPASVQTLARQQLARKQKR